MIVKWFELRTRQRLKLAVRQISVEQPVPTDAVLRVGG